MPKYNSPLNKKGNSNPGYLYDLTEAASDYIIDKIINSQSDEDFINFYTERFNGLDYGEQEVLNKISAIKIDDKPAIQNPHRPMPKKELIKDQSGKASYPRDINKAINALKLSGYKCEFNKNHPTFKRKKDGKPYTETHHLIPLSKHFDFENDLDVEANIISLCSNCHNLIHYGEDFEKILLRLYDERKLALSEAGIGIEFNILLGYYK